MSLRATLRILVLLVSAALAMLPQLVVAQSAPDTIFTEIELSPEGVVAYDSAGFRWEYNFTDGVFVRGDRVGQRDRRGGERPRTETRELEAAEDRCTEELTVKPFQKSVQVGIDEFVSGDIVAYGRITIKGWVQGSVQSINDKVLVTETGQVDGDVKAPEIQIKRGGNVLGQQIITNPLDFPVGRIAGEYTPSGIWVVFAFTIYLLLCTFVVVSLMSRQSGVVSDAIRMYPLRSFGLGVIAIFMIPVLIILLAITIVGILAIAFLPFLYVFAMSLGVIAWGQRVGAWFLTAIGRSSRSPLVAALIGALLFMTPWFLAAMMMGSDGTVFGLGVALLVLISLLSLVPIFTGLGAVILTRFGSRRYLSLHDRLGTPDEGAPVPAPPPIPKVPPSLDPIPPPHSGEHLPPRPAHE